MDEAQLKHVRIGGPATAGRFRPAVGVLELHAALWLAGLVALSAAIRFAVALWMPVPWIFADELRYSEFAKSFAVDGHFSVRGVGGLDVGPLYPVLISPAYAVFSSVPHAYVAVKAINAVVMSLAAVPAYLLARRLLTRPWSLAAAALTLAVPSMTYTGMVMTENLFYPLFLFTVLAMVRMFERPAAGRQLAVLGLIGLACLIRPQGVGLVAALLCAIAVDAWWERPLSQRLARYLPTWLALGGGLLALGAVQLALGRSFASIFGSAQGVWYQHYSPVGVGRWLVYHLAELDLYSGVLPFAAFLLLATFLFRRGQRSLKIFALVSVSCVIWTLFVAAAFASGLSRYDIHAASHTIDRYTFYVTPLLVIALLAWVSARMPRSTATIAAAAAAAGLLPLVLPFGRLIRNQSVADSLGLLLWARSEAGVIVAVPHVLARVALATFVLAALFFLLRRPRLTRLAPLLVLVYFAAALSAAQLRMHAVSAGASTAVGQKRDWIDRVIGYDQEAVVIWSGRADPHVIWENEFFNRSVGRVYYLRQPSWAGLPEEKLTVNRRTGGLVDEAGTPLKARFALADPWVVLRGRVVARDRTSGMKLYRLTGQIARISAL
jgi:hypothetical protein